METSQKEKIVLAGEYLKHRSSVDLDGMVAKLRVKKILTPKQMEALIAIFDRGDKLDKFIFYMQRKGLAAFEAFQDWFKSNFHEITFKRFFGTEDERKESHSFTEEEEEDDSTSDDTDDESSDEEPPMKKSKPEVTNSEAAQVKEVKKSGKCSKGKAKGKGKNTKEAEKIQNLERVSSETVNIDDLVDEDDPLWISIKADPLSKISPNDKGQLYRLHIGKQIFTTAGEYQGKFYFHIRRYKGDKLFPSVGVAFTNENFQKFRNVKEEMEEALKFPSVGVENLRVQLDDQIRVTIVDDKLDIRKMITIQDKINGPKLVFTRSGVRINMWQFKNLFAVLGHLSELIPNFAE